jgi:hypothetical protein
VVLEPVECRARGPCAIEARRTHDHQLVGSIENAPRRRCEDACGGVEADEVVVALEHADGVADGAGLDRVRDL